MKDMQYDRLVTFTSVHQAIKAEKALEKAGIEAYSLPTPREIDASCGLALAFHGAQEPEVLAAIAMQGAVWSKLYRRNGTLRLFEKISEYEG